MKIIEKKKIYSAKNVLHKFASELRLGDVIIGSEIYDFDKRFLVIKLKKNAEYVYISLMNLTQIHKKKNKETNITSHALHEKEYYIVEKNRKIVRKEL